MKSKSLPDFAKGLEHREEHGWNVWSVRNPHELTQVAGYLRFVGEGGLSLFRGQTALHRDMLASAFRRAEGKPVGRAGVGRHATALGGYIDKIVGAACKCDRAKKFVYAHECDEVVTSKGALLNGTHRAAVEPLLQHYGLNTRWVDVVDNIWVALWFACHEQVSIRQFAHHTRRSPAQEGAGAKAYVFVLSTGPLEQTGVPGYQVSPTVRFVDLRYCVPSLYLRPHAQHGALIAPRKIDMGTVGSPIGSIASQVAGVLEVDLNDALLWLGQGSMTSMSVLFPSATHDAGYRLLLEHSPTPPTSLGHLTIYGPSE